jgi:MFS family permease
MLTLVPGNASAVGLLQAVAALPTFLFVLPAGVLADIVNRRKLLISAQIVMIVIAGLLALVTASGVTTARMLLLFTFALSAGAALGAPAFQAWVPDLVPNAQIPAAVALTSLSGNTARAVGPAIGGLAVSLAGPAAAFGLNAISTIAVLGVLVAGRRAAPQPEPERLPPEHFLPALRAGARYVRHGGLLRRTIARSFLFFFPGSVLWALLPVVGRNVLGLTPVAYGGLACTLGAGAVAGGLALSAIRRKFTPDSVIAVSSVVFSAAAVGFGIGAARGSVVLSCLALPFAGGSWIMALAHFNVAAQGSVAGWVKARALALYLVAVAGATTAGAVLWGLLAQYTNPSSALFSAAGLLIAGMLAAHWLSLAEVGTLDLTPAAARRSDENDWSNDFGPVLVEIEYEVAPENDAAFNQAMLALRRSRLRTGAYTWAHLRDREHPMLHREHFWLESWLDHLRQRRIRETAFDAGLRQRTRALTVTGSEPKVRHFIRNPDWRGRHPGKRVR